MGKNRKDTIGKDRENNAGKGRENPWRRLCAALLGIVFLLGGVFKLMDPLGSGLVVESYLNFFHLGWMRGIAKALGWIPALLEAFLGAALISGVRRRLCALLTCALTGAYTLLTAILLLFNPDMDCGCFGEWIHLSHLQSFLKNLGLCLLCAGTWAGVREFARPKVRKWVSFGLAALSVLVFGIWELFTLPLEDYGTFRPGTEIAAAETTDAAPAFEAAYLYEKDGMQQEFPLEALPDSSRTFVEARTREVSAAAQPPVLALSDASGTSCDSLAAGERVFLLSRWRGTPSQKTQQWAEEACALGYAVYFVSLPQATTSLIDSQPAAGKVLPGQKAAPQLFSDRKTLMSLNRSNGGATLLCGGKVIRKWPACSLPDAESLQEMLTEEEEDILISAQSKGSTLFQSFLLYIFAVLLLL